MPRDPFQWNQEGISHIVISESTEGVFAHEVLFEDEASKSQERHVYIAQSIPLKRIRLLGWLLMSACVFLVGRAFWMQIIQGAEYQARAERNRLRHETLLPRRGVIRDRTGVVLAQNTPSFDVQATPRDLPSQPEAREEVFGTIARALGGTVDEIHAAFASSTDPDESVVLQRDVPYDRAVALQIATAREPGVHTVIQSKRQYPLSATMTSLSHVLGYVGGITREELKAHANRGYQFVDLIGKTGVESSYESFLRGMPGERLYEVDSRGRVMGVVGERAPVDGQDVTLTIDASIQRAAETALKNELEKAQLTRGAVVAMDPRDGSILAIVSLPSYDNNFFSGSVSSTVYKALIADPDRPLLPRAWGGTYPSGSTIKPVIATAALAEGIVTPQTAVVSTGGIHVGPWFFPDWKAGGHGSTNVRRAIAWSVNTFFYYVGGGYNSFVGLGVDRLTDWMRRFGLGQRTGLDVVGEATGFVPSQEWKQRVKNERWFIGDTYNLSIGQGDLLVTPLQVALFTARVANGGYAVTPHLVQTIGTAYGSSTRQLPRATLPQIASAEVVRTVQQGMRDTVVYGSGRALSVLPFSVAGKTGTAQWRSDKANHAWWTSFAPAESPRIVVTVLLEEGVEGSRTAITVAREVLSAWWHVTRGGTSTNVQDREMTATTTRRVGF